MLKFVNLYQKLLTQPVAADVNATTLYVSDVPTVALGAGEYLIACLESITPPNTEIVKVEAINTQSNTLTVVRGYDNTSPTAFAIGDKVEIRLTAGTCAEFLQRTEIATPEQAQTGDDDTKVMTPAKVKAALDYGLPVGSIIAWLPGHFTAVNNGGSYVSLFSSADVAGAKVWLAANAAGWRVADGTESNLAGTLIWNAAGRFLPNLTDSRFLVGGELAGSLSIKGTDGTAEAGHEGSNLMVNHKHGHSLSTTSNGNDQIDMGGYSVLVGHGGSYWVLSSHTGAPAAYQNFGASTEFSNTQHTHGISGEIGTGSADVAANTTENRPKYLSTFYIIKVA